MCGMVRVLLGLNLFLGSELRIESWIGGFDEFFVVIVVIIQLDHHSNQQDDNEPIIHQHYEKQRYQIGKIPQDCLGRFYKELFNDLSSFPGLHALGDLLPLCFLLYSVSRRLDSLDWLGILLSRRLARILGCHSGGLSSSLKDLLPLAQFDLLPFLLLDVLVQIVNVVLIARNFALLHLLFLLLLLFLAFRELLHEYPLLFRVN